MVDIDSQNSLLVISLHYIGDIISLGDKITHFILYMQIFRPTIMVYSCPYREHWGMYHFTHRDTHIDKCEKRDTHCLMLSVVCVSLRRRWSLADEADFIALRSQLTLPTKPTSSGDEDVIIFWWMFIRSSDSYCAWCNGRLLHSRSGRVRE